MINFTTEENKPDMAKLLREAVLNKLKHQGMTQLEIEQWAKNLAQQMTAPND